MPAKRPFPFKLGADPEFNIILQNRRIAADRLLKSLFRDQCNSSLMGCKIDAAGVLGWDGASATGEFRPAPSNQPDKVAANLGKLIGAFAEKGSLFELSTLSKKASVGGHVHIELPDRPNEQVLQGRHKKLSSFYLPLMLGEDSLNLRLRLKIGYGKIMEYRCEEHSGALTYEFRAPTAEWTTTEKIARSTLAYLATVWHELTANPKNFNQCRDIVFANASQGQSLQHLAISHFALLAEIYLKKIRKYIRSFEYYPDYKEEIDYILAPDKVLRDKQKAGFDLMQGWNLNQEVQFTKRKLLSERHIASLAEKIDLDALLQTVSLPYNSDTNVEDMVRALKTRILCLNWKLKRQYFFFGLKKGIKSYFATEVKLNDQLGPDGDGLRLLAGAETVKTKDDLATIGMTFARMRDRARSALQTQLGFSDVIMIGLPYEDRIKGERRPLIELVYNIERGRQKASALASSELSDGPGELAKSEAPSEAPSEADSLPLAPENNDQALREVQAELTAELPF